uniref:DUF4817 domain-containing protein n=1 Tax=Macrostomum lignano TaxID=282301 RepID=A0A1I8JPY4_9PLAT
SRPGLSAGTRWLWCSNRWTFGFHGISRLARLRRRPKVPAQRQSPQAQAQHQQQSADVEREFQAAMQFYSRGGGSGGAKTAKALLKSFNGSVSRANRRCARSSSFRRVDNSTDCWRLSAGRPPPSPSIRRPRRRQRRFCEKAAAAAGVPSDLGDARGRRPTGSAGPRLGRRRAEHHGTACPCRRLLAEQPPHLGVRQPVATCLIDCSACGEPLVGPAFSQRSTRSPSHQPRKAVFPRFAPPQPGSEPSHPDRLELVERRARASGVTRSSIWRPAQA